MHFGLCIKLSSISLYGPNKLTICNGIDFGPTCSLTFGLLTDISLNKNNKLNISLYSDQM